MSYSAELFPLILTMTAAGAVSGFFAGLMGIGGGIIILPVLYFAFQALATPPDHLMHMSLGTTLAIVVFTAFLSSRAHYKRGAVLMPIVLSWAPFIVAGSIAGAMLAPHIKNQALVMLFATLAFIMGLKFIFHLNFAGKTDEKSSEPPKGGMVAFIIGTLSSLMGIGGATFTVPYMTHYGVAIINAVATASMLGLFISVSATAGYLYSGMGVENLPAFSFGFVNLMAVAIIAPLSMAMAPIGVMVAHKLPHRALSIIFGCFLILTSLRLGAPNLLPF